MNSREKYDYWLEAAQYDLDSARVMMYGGRYMYVAFMSQQAVEKLAKGIYTLYTGNEPPMIHNIWNVLRQLKREVNLSEYIPINQFEEDLQKYKSFFAELLSYYISGRYPSFKEKISSTIDSNRAKRVLNNTEEVFQWIKSLNQYKK
ncbi:HEPN domain-containing protein [Clostridium sp. P21]|uniref:HEPN domain-containing protein n=1 Tax=Clostridium muellerianum TaxID=2716538 RepID=A0A7Y0HRR0_9CLOT|nr:HEPN domain-containing protein [Clostridium muellerianum]NMM65118.1 HEPN domain-containing protein [Clostridium muellerianum]